MLCPNCDCILNIRGCLSCGWKNGDPWPQYRLFKESVNPLKPGPNYPPRPDAPVAPLMLRNFGRGMIDTAPAVVKESEQVSNLTKGGDPVSTVDRWAESKVEKTGPPKTIPDPVSKTVK